jgi:hypothetical protein
MYRSPRLLPQPPPLIRERERKKRERERKKRKKKKEKKEKNRVIFTRRKGGENINHHRRRSVQARDR